MDEYFCSEEFFSAIFPALYLMTALLSLGYHHSTVLRFMRSIGALNPMREDARTMYTVWMEIDDLEFQAACSGK